MTSFDADLIGFLLSIGTIFFIFGIRIFFRINQRKYLPVWKRMAENAGLEFKSGSFASPSIKDQPKIQGQFKEREVEISADTRWRISYRYALLKFVVSINNPSSLKFPAGAFIIIGKDPHYNHLFAGYRNVSGETKTDHDDIKTKFIIRSVPINLVNYLLREESTNYLLSKPGVFSLLIDRNKLSYSLSGFVGEEESMLEILETLCELANSFDSFARNWL